MTIENAFKKATGLEIREAVGKVVFGGYSLRQVNILRALEEGADFYKNEILLDPLFWKCLGKEMKWQENKFYVFDFVHPCVGAKIPEAKWYMLNFIQNLWED